MKVKIIDKKSEDNNKEFKVRRMTLEDIIVNYPTGTGLKNFFYEQVELISEGEIDEFLIKNKYMLSIKLNRGISVFFYKVLKESIEEEIKEELKDFNLLRDKYNINRKKIWEKEIICVVNNKYPIMVKGTGQNFKREGYNIIITSLEVEGFLESCKEEINKILIEISRKEILLSRYGRAINNIKNNSENQVNLLIEERI